jgi:hypothetical protein
MAGNANRRTLVLFAGAGVVVYGFLQLLDGVGPDYERGGLPFGMSMETALVVGVVGIFVGNEIAAWFGRDAED